MGDQSLNEICLEYSASELFEATRNFDLGMRLGSGSFGGVFRGIQKDGTEIAIKVLDVPEESGFEEEVRVLSKFRHPNLVILMGFARADSTRFLVYEYLAGGDVFTRLQRSCVENVPFTWRQRVSAIFDACCGLSRLHNATPKVFHRDIKSPNILLDRNGTGKMADFGLACISKSLSHKVKQASGTVGYACPHYVQRGVVTEGSEVYSFGIVLLEVLTASPPAYLDGKKQYQFLVSHLRGDVRKAVSLADAKAQWPLSVAGAIAELALRCTHDVEELRPPFTELVNTMRALRDAPDVASAPAEAGAPPLCGFLAEYSPSAFPRGASSPAKPVRRPAMDMLSQTTDGIARTGMSEFEGAADILSQTMDGVMGGRQACGAPQTPWRPRASLATSLHGAMSRPQPELGKERWGICSPRHLNAHPIQGLPPAPPPSETQAAAQLALATRIPAQHVPPPPLLWTLECVVAEGSDMRLLRPQQRTLVHRSEVGSSSLTAQRVGRLFQGEFLDALLPETRHRNAVSREHFQVWAEEFGTPSGDSPKMPCAFFLTNFSCNGTTVNGKLLLKRGEQAPLHAGDSISLTLESEEEAAAEGESEAMEAGVPFLVLRFDLSGSVLADGDVPPCSAHGSDGCRQEGNPPKGTAAPSPASLNLDLEPLVSLEVQGPGVRGGLSREACTIIHGPPRGAPASQCIPLVLGRALNTAFWQRVLRDEAFELLSRQYLAIDVCGDDDGCVTFHVQSLSVANPIRLCNRLGGEHNPSVLEAVARPIQVGERWALQDGDALVAVSQRDCMVWLIFGDILAAGAAGCEFGSSVAPYA